MILDALMNMPTALPVVPKVVHTLIQTFEREDVSIDEVARCIGADPGLSAKLLRLANSPYYRTPRRIQGVDDAILLLGFSTVRTLVLGAGLTRAFTRMEGLDLPSFWRHSLRTAVAARWLAKPLQHSPDLAFTTGLMHGLGLLVMRAGMPDLMREMDTRAAPLDEARIEVERATLGYAYSDVGAALMTRWHFPEVFATAIRAMPDPLAGVFAGPVFCDTAALLHVAAWRVRAGVIAPQATQAGLRWPADVCAALGLDAHLVLREMPAPAELARGLEDLVA